MDTFIILLAGVAAMLAASRFIDPALALPDDWERFAPQKLADLEALFVKDDMPATLRARAGRHDFNQEQLL